MWYIYSYEAHTGDLRRGAARAASTRIRRCGSGAGRPCCARRRPPTWLARTPRTSPSVTARAIALPTGLRPSSRDGPTQVYGPRARRRTAPRRDLALRQQVARQAASGRGPDAPGGAAPAADTAMVAPITSTIRGLPSEVVVGANEGLRHDSADQPRPRANRRATPAAPLRRVPQPGQDAPGLPRTCRSYRLRLTPAQERPRRGSPCGCPSLDFAAGIVGAPTRGAGLCRSRLAIGLAASPPASSRGRTTIALDCCGGTRECVAAMRHFE